LGLPVKSKFGYKNIFTWATVKENGFTDMELNTITELTFLLMSYLEGFHENRIMKILLSTYLGSKTGEQVLTGKVYRGDIEKIKAAIWYSDLRGFTAMSEKMESVELVAWLNDYFEVISKVIEQHNGEILKFIGDAILAVFPVTEYSSVERVCHEALNAAKKANAKLNQLNDCRQQKGAALLDHGIALHEGEVQYGNIGSQKRLDFTIIGQAVNLTSRIEGLCGKLGERTLVSQKFASYFGNEPICIGTFELKGIANPQKIYTF
jgi:adenylate cyclase